MKEVMEIKENNVRFHASSCDCELIMQLLMFVAGKSLPGFIGFTDVYSKEPWELIGQSSKKTHYFLTQLKKKDTRFNRATRGGGSWSQQHKGKAIFDEDEKLVIGYKRTLKFKHKKDPSLNGQWMMKEYFLADSLLRQLKSNETKDFVICAIKKNPRSVIKVIFLFVGRDILHCFSMLLLLHLMTLLVRTSFTVPSVRFSICGLLLDDGSTEDILICSEGLPDQCWPSKLVFAACSLPINNLKVTLLDNISEQHVCH